MEYYRLILYIAFGTMPSLAWLFYYLSKDLHPEPKKAIIKVFLWGAAITIPVFLIQLGLSELLKSFSFLRSSPLIFIIIKWFFVIALTEELFKYLAVKISVLRKKELDEPLDIMLYMVVAALGFAAVENVLYLFSPLLINGSFNAFLQTTVILSFVRFIGATFLHTLCSALLGYFLALSFLRSKQHIKFLTIGLILATLLHGLYNFSIINLSGPLNFIIPVIVIIGLAGFIIYDFDEIKKIKSICKIS